MSPKRCREQRGAGKGQRRGTDPPHTWPWVHTGACGTQSCSKGAQCRHKQHPGRGRLQGHCSTQPYPHRTQSNTENNCKPHPPAKMGTQPTGAVLSLLSHHQQPLPTPREAWLHGMRDEGSPERAGVWEMLCWQAGV